MPPLIRQELEALDTDENPAFESAEGHFFLAYKEGAVVGRIAALINWTEVREQGRKKLRFSWFDVIDDLEVTRALIQEVEKIAQEKGFRFLEGPMGLSNLDKAGLLVAGFKEVGTLATWYNFPYYESHLRALGFEKATEWVEYRIEVPSKIPERVQRFAKLIQEKYHLKVVRFQSKRKLAQQADALFDLIAESYQSLSVYTPISERQKQHYIEKFIRFIHLDYLMALHDATDSMIAFGITMPSYAKALQKAKGKRFPFGFMHLLRASRKNERAAFYLIGIKPAFQKKGLIALISNEMLKTFTKRGVKVVESNPELIDNKSVQALWGHYKHKRHKLRRTYKKEVG